MKISPFIEQLGNQSIYFGLTDITRDFPFLLFNHSTGAVYSIGLTQLLGWYCQFDGLISHVAESNPTDDPSDVVDRLDSLWTSLESCYVDDNVKSLKMQKILQLKVLANALVPGYAPLHLDRQFWPSEWIALGKNPLTGEL